MKVTPISKTLRQAFIDCHADGHQWRHEGLLGGSDPGARPPFTAHDSVARVSVCASCTSERFRWYTRSGEVINRYRHAEGYLHERTSEDDVAPTRQEWRQRLVVTLFDDVGKPRRRKRRAAS